MKKLIIPMFLSLNVLSIQLTEDKLISWANKENFNIQKIELQKMASELNHKAFQDKFQANLQTSYKYYNTKETSFSSFAPITTPIKSAEVILSKPTMYGVNGSIKASTQQSSNNYYQNGTTAILGASLSIDLYKDIFGKATRANNESLLIKNEIANKEVEITKHSFVQEVRKIYWSLVANNESLNIAKELLETAKKLESDTSARFKNNIADSGELARTKSQVESRNGQILLLQFEKSELTKRLKSLFPNETKNVDIKLGAYNLDKTINEILACTVNISSKTSTPNEYTMYDDVLNLLRQDKTISQKLNNTYSQADLKLISEYNYIGKDYSHTKAIDEVTSDGRNQYAIGFQLNIPLGSSKKDTQDIQEQIINNSNVAKYQEIEGKLNAYHSQTVESINVLYKVIAAQKRNSALLSETLKSSKTKFKQARLSARDLIIDEDNLLQSNLNEISTKYNVISILIDYFSVFTQTPCSINK